MSIHSLNTPALDSISQLNMADNKNGRDEEVCDSNVCVYICVCVYMCMRLCMCVYVCVCVQYMHSIINESEHCVDVCDHEEDDIDAGDRR